MKKLTLALVAVLLVMGFIYLQMKGNFEGYPHQEEHYVALANFQYVGEPKGQDTYLAYKRIDRPFQGDCEDYAFTLKHQIGGTVKAVMHPTAGPHAVLVKDGYVYDNLSPEVLILEDYPAQFYNDLEFTGEYITN